MPLRFLVAWIAVVASACAAPSTQLKWQRIDLGGSQTLLQGPPQTAGMHSGEVALKPGEDMHRHTTGEHEELLVFLAGRARIVLGSELVEVGEGQVLYIPPHTEHEVRNDGAQVARYVYVVAPVR